MGKVFGLRGNDIRSEQERGEEEKDEELLVLHASLVAVFHRSVRSRNVLAFVKNIQKRLSTTHQRSNLLNKHFETSFQDLMHSINLTVG